MTKSTPLLYPEIVDFIDKLILESITSKRKSVLQPLINFIHSKISLNNDIQLIFICTHNSRRSHLSQVWAQTMANYFNIKNLICYSGGTEKTELSPLIIETLHSTGFKINTLSKEQNSIYCIKYYENSQPIIGFSKLFDDDFNPKSQFAAIMTCSQADNDCPFVEGAQNQISIPYDDPKTFDHTPLQATKYKEINIQIATEMMYVMKTISTISTIQN